MRLPLTILRSKANSERSWTSTGRELSESEPLDGREKCRGEAVEGQKSRMVETMAIFSDGNLTGGFQAIVCTSPFGGGASPYEFQSPSIL